MKKSWIFTLLCISLVAFAACNSKAKRADIVEEEGVMIMDIDTVTPADTASLSFITEWVGKYPQEVNLFGLNVLSDRLKQLMGMQYDSMMANWNTETPIEVEDSIIHTSGCKAHDCPADDYELYIDLADNNINVYNLRNDSLQIYAEQDTIALPTKMKANLRVILSNANITFYKGL